MAPSTLDPAWTAVSAPCLADRFRGVVENLIASTQASAVALMALSPRDGSHHPVLNVDYQPETLDAHSTERFTRQCAPIQRILMRPHEIHYWEDIPNFRDSWAAEAMYVPAGFRNGASIVLQSAAGETVAMLHVSITDERVSSATKAALSAVRPLLATWATTYVRYALANLSARELDVLAAMRDGLSNGQIAEALVLSPRTITTHVENILRKLGSSNRTEAAVFAERYGLVRPQ